MAAIGVIALSLGGSVLDLPAGAVQSGKDVLHKAEEEHVRRKKRHPHVIFLERRVDVSALCPYTAFHWRRHGGLCGSLVHLLDVVDG